MKVKRKGALGALLAVVRRWASAVSVSRIRVRRGQRIDHDRLGVRQQGQHGALRRSRAGRGAGTASSRSTRAVACRSRSSPATRRTTIRPRPSRARSACSARARTSSSRPATSTTPRRSCRRPSTAACSRSPLHRHRSDGPEALRLEGRARVQLRQRRAGRGLGHGAVGLRQGLAHGRHRARTPCSSTSRTSCRRSRPASSSSAARSSRHETLRDRAPTTCRRPSAG